MAKLPKSPFNPCEDFLSHFSGNHIFVSISPKGKTLNWAGTIESVYPALQERERFNWGSYFTVNEFKDGRRILENIIRCRAIWSDDDDSNRSTPRSDFPLEPSIIVQTSEKKWHYYWLTNTTEFDQWRGVMERMITTYGADMGAKDLARVLRLPGTLNTKYDKEFICQVYSSTGRVYRWDEILDNFPPMPIDMVKETASPHVSGTKVSLVELMKRFNTAESIAPSINSLIMHWRWHYSEENTKDMVLDLFQNIPDDVYREHTKRYENARIQIDKFIGTASKKVRAHQISESRKESTEIMYRDIGPLNAGLIQSKAITSEMIPKILWDAAESCGEYLSIGPEPSILTGLATVCSILNKNVLIKHIENSPYESYCTMGMVMVMETGTRKSEIFKIMSKPYRDYEKHLQKNWEQDKHTKLQERKLLEFMLKKMEKKFQKNETASTEDIMHAAQEQGLLLKRMDELQLDKPTLYAKDITEEEIINKMRENGGAISIMSDDSRKIIQNILGRYASNSNTNESIYIDGLTGQPEVSIKYNRVRDGGTEIVIHGPALNVFLFVQQDVALRLKKHEVYHDSGLAARLPLYFFPVDIYKMMKNSNRAKQLDNEALYPYYSVLQGLCHTRKDNPLQIKCSDGAQVAFQELMDYFTELVKGDESCNILLNKMITQSVVYSICMAALDDVDFMHTFKADTDVSYILKRKHANMGTMLAKVICEQTLTTHSLLENIEIYRIARAFAASLQKKVDNGLYADGFTRSSYLYQAFSMLNKDNYIKVVDLLTDKGWLGTSVSDKTRRLNQGTTQAAKPNETVYHLNPEASKYGKIEQFSKLSGISD